MKMVRNGLHEVHTMLKIAFPPWKIAHSPLRLPAPSFPLHQVGATERRDEGVHTVGNFFAPYAMPSGNLRPLLKLTMSKFSSGFREFTSTSNGSTQNVDCFGGQVLWWKTSTEESDPRGARFLLLLSFITFLP